MPAIWRFRINVVNPQDAEKMKEYVRELSKEYSLVPISDDPDDGWYQAGLEYGDDYVCYTDWIGERLEQFNEIGAKVAAHFPEMKLQFTQCNTDNQGIYRYESKDGEFFPVRPLKVSLHTDDADDFDQLVACAMPLLTTQDIKAEVNDNTHEITWEYSEENEVQVCDALIAKMSELMPDIQVVCMKHDVDNPQFGGLQYCIMGKGEGEWKKITGATFDIAYAIWYAGLHSALGLTVYDAFTNPEKCVKTVLEVIRKSDPQGDNILKYSVKNIMFQVNKFCHLLQPEDKQWLLDLDSTEADCIVLAGMYRSWRTWEESFTDEDTGETVTVERHEILTTPLFESHEGEAEALLEKVCKDRDTRRKIKDIVWTLSTYTPLNYTRLLVENADDLGEDDRRWAYKEIGDLYRWGKEEFGFFIDKQKAKEYYDKAGVTDENPLEDSCEGFEEPYIFEFTIKGRCDELKALIMEHAEQPEDDPLGIYARVNGIINRLIDNDERRHEYRGNILHVDEDGGNIVVTAELPDAFPLRAAIQHRYPGLEIEVEEVFYED